MKSRLPLWQGRFALAALFCPSCFLTACAPARQASVRPGINAEYRDPDVDKWIERFETESREIYKDRNQIVAEVGLRRADYVADIGAGTGVFTFLFAEKVGPRGRVWAVDIVPEFLELVRTRAAERKLSNVHTVLCSEVSAKLPSDSIDVAFLCDTYHHLEYPASTLASIHRALRTRGQLIVIDFKRIEGVSRQWVLDHVRAGQDVVIQEIESAGFELLEIAETPYLDENYFLRFRKKG